MLLRARLFPSDDGGREIIERLSPLDSLKPTSGRYPVAVGDPALTEILRAGDGAGGFSVSAESVFTRTELRDISHFEVVCRKFVSETDEDYAHNAAACEGAALVEAGGEEPIRLVSGFALTRVELKPNMAGAIGDWTTEYVVGRGIVEAFEQEGLSGWSAKSVLNPKTRSNHADFVQLYSDVVLRPAAIDCSVERIQSEVPEEEGCLRHLGCLSYAAADLAGQPDFIRTAEPWGGWSGWPSWVVSSRVPKVFTARKLRGWAFRPVLTTESRLYRQYLDRWQILCELVAGSASSDFDGGRW